MADNPQVTRPIYGLMAEFETPEALLAAVRRARLLGYNRIDAYTPFPVEGMAEAMNLGHTWLSYIILAGGIFGGLLGYLMQYVSSVIAYPINSGGKPYNSWPAFIPITFETTILFAAFAAVIGMLTLNNLPQPYHPVFNVPSFSAASQDRFFLSIEARDPRFKVEETRDFLQSLDPITVSEIEP